MTSPRGGSRRWRTLRARVLRQSQTCWLCGQLIDMSLSFPHPMSASVDHVIPVAHAPDREFDMTNLRPAHLVHNQQRGTGEPVEIVASSYDW